MCLCTQSAFFVQVPFEVILDLHKAFQQNGVECAALAVQDHLDGLFVRIGPLVAALTGQGIVDIRQRDDLRFDGNFVLFQAVRIAAAIPALMMPAGNAVGGLQQRFGVEIFQLPQHI